MERGVDAAFLMLPVCEPAAAIGLGPVRSSGRFGCPEVGETSQLMCRYVRADRGLPAWFWRGVLCCNYEFGSAVLCAPVIGVVLYCVLRPSLSVIADAASRVVSDSSVELALTAFVHRGAGVGDELNP